MIRTASQFWIEVAPFLTATGWQDTQSVAAAAGMSLLGANLGLKKGVELGLVEEDFKAQKHRSGLKPYYRRKP